MIVGLEDLIKVVSKKILPADITVLLVMGAIDIVKSFQELKKQNARGGHEIVSALVYHGVSFKISRVIQQNVHVPGLNGPLATFESENLENIFVKRTVSALVA